MRKISIILLAFIIALLGVSMLRSPQADPRRDALLLFLLAGLIMALVARPLAPWPDLRAQRGQRDWPRWAFGLTIFSVILAAVGIVLFWQAPPGDLQFTGLPLTLWLISIPLFIVGAWPNGRNLPEPAGALAGAEETEAAAESPDALEVTPTLEALPTPVVTVPDPASRARRPFAAALRTWLARPEIIALIILLAVAFFLRVYQINTFPNGCQSDECNNGMDALKWLNGRPYTPYAETNEGQATLFTYLIALMFKLAGVGVTQMRLVSAIVATATLLAFYFLARELFDWRIALPTTALFAVSRWHLTFSRIVYELIMVPLVESLLFLFLIRAVRYGRRRDWSWTGLMLALGMNTYTAFRVVPFVVGIFLLYWLLTHWRQWRALIEGGLIMAAGGIVGAAPLGVYIIQHWSVFIGRTRHISVFNDIENAGGSLKPLWDNLDKVLWSFHWRGDVAALNNLPGAPLLDAVVGALVILGLAYMLRHLWRPLPFLSFTWIIVVGSVAVLSVAHEAPTARRPIGLLPVIFLLVGLVLDRAWDAYLTAWRLPKTEPARARTLQRASQPFLLALLALVLYVGAVNADTFFNKQAKDPSVWRAFSASEAAIGQYLRDLPPNAQVYLSPAFERHSAVELISRRRPYTLLNLAEHLPLRDIQADHDVVYVMEALDQRLVPLMQQIYPAGVADYHRDPFGASLFVSYRVPAAAVAQGRGLIARFYPGASTASLSSPKPDGAPAIERRDAPIDFDWKTTAPPLQAPFNVRWQGALFTGGGYGEYTFELTADGAAELWINDKPLLQIKEADSQRTQAMTVTLPGGFQGIALTYNSGSQPGRVRLAWSGPGTPLETVPAGALYALEIANSGLIGYYYPNGDASGQPARVQHDIFVLANPVLPEPFSIIWRGKIAAPQSGQYIFGTRADDGALVSINGKLVADNGGSHGSEYREGSIFLEQGFHDIEVKYWQIGGSRELQLWWQPPGGAKEIVPSVYLFPIQDAMPTNIVLPAPPAPKPIEPPSVEATPVAGEQPGAATQPPVAAAGTLGNLPDLAATVLWQTGACGAGNGQFNEPRGVAVDAEGNVYVADAGNRRIVKLDKGGKFIAAWGREGEGDGQFLEPFDLGVSPDGTLVVLDAVQQRMQRFSPDGQFAAAFGAENTFYRPRGLWVDGQGGLWVADTGGIRILKLDQAGKKLSQIGGRDEPPIGQGQPTDVATGPGGDIWVAEATNGILWHLAADGTIVKSVGLTPAGTLEGPHLATGRDGRLYATDPESFRVVVLAPDGTPVGQFGAEGNEPGQFRKALGIAVSAEGQVFVVDTLACKVTAFAAVP